MISLNTIAGIYETHDAAIAALKASTESGLPVRNNKNLIYPKHQENCKYIITLYGNNEISEKAKVIMHTISQ